MVKLMLVIICIKKLCDTLARMHKTRMETKGEAFVMTKADRSMLIKWGSVLLLALLLD